MEIEPVPSSTIGLAKGEKVYTTTASLALAEKKNQYHKSSTTKVGLAAGERTSTTPLGSALFTQKVLTSP